MKKTFTFNITADVVEHDYYDEDAHLACLRCAFYSVCTAVSNMYENFPFSFKVNGDYPCRQLVQSPDRKYYLFSSPSK